MRSRLALLATLALCFAAPAPAHAGSFTVSSCRDAVDGQNHAWTPTVTQPGSTTAGDGCGSAGTRAGLWVSEILGAQNASTDALVSWSLTAPAGTRITGIDYDRWGRIFSDAGWRPGLSTAEGDVLDWCGFGYPQFDCEFGSRFGHGRFAKYDLSTSRLAFGAKCVPTRWGACETGGTMHSLEMVLYGARVSIEDDEAPSAAAPLTALADGAWHSAANASINASASDNTGIRVRRLLVDGVARNVETAPGKDDGGCGELDEGVAYGYTRPCEGARGLNGARTSIVDLSAWPDGTHELRLAAVDTGGLETTSAATVVRLDRSAPGAAVATDGRWSATAGGQARWTVPVEHDRAPVTRIETETCAPSSGCQVSASAGAAFGATLGEDFAALPEGETTIRVRLTDAAGNLGGWSAPAVLRRDRQLPRLSVGAVPTSVAPGASLTLATQASDERSGVERIEREHQTDGGRWLVHSRPIVAQAGTTYRFRARAVDRAGNATGWLTSGETRVASGAGPVPSTGQPRTPSRTLEDQPTPTPAKRSPRLRLTRTRLTGTVLRVGGRLQAGASGRITVTVADRSNRRSRSTPVRAGRFATAIRLPRALVRSRASVLTLRYAGDELHAAATKRSRLPRSPGR